MTPTYFEPKMSYLDGIMTTKMKLFNRRVDVQYYELSVFDSEWNPIPFASANKIIQIEYLGRKTIEIYFKKEDTNRLTYICTTSKIVKGDLESSIISSKICSKIKEKE